MQFHLGKTNRGLVLRFIHEIGFAQNDQISVVQLAFNCVTDIRVFCLLADRFSIGQYNDAINLKPLQQRNRSRDCAGQGDAAGFQQHMVRPWLQLCQIHHRECQVVAIAATNATTGNADHGVVLRLNEIFVDGQFAELVDQHSETFAIRIAQQVIDESGNILVLAQVKVACVELDSGKPRVLDNLLVKALS